MRRIEPLACSPLQRFDEIAAAKRAPTDGILRALRGQVEQQFAHYQQQAPHLEQLRAIDVDADQRKALLSCYNVETAARHRLVAEIKGKHAYCPYCEIYDPETVDHYLPQDEYPELAVCHLNMLPCCPRCNTLKGESWHDAGRRQFLHFYFDAIDDRRTYLMADITLHDDLPQITYRIELPPDGDHTFYELYRRHCEQLHLLKRFERRAEREIVRMREDTSAWTRIPEDAEKPLSDQYEKRRDRLGPNHWEVALLRTVAASPDIIAWCCGTMGTPGQGTPS